MVRGEVVYEIYKLESRSGMVYVGLTKYTSALRWGQHRRKARATAGRHPLYDCIRAHGADYFTVTHVASALGKERAKATECACIAQEPKELSLNISPGGDADGEAAAAVFWARIRQDPEGFAKYRAKLRKAMLARVLPPEVKAGIAAAAQQWRKDNPRVAWKNSYHASRISLRAAPGVGRTDDRTLKERLLAKHKHRRPRGSVAVTKVWASRSETQRAQQVSRKISASVKALYDDALHREKVREDLVRARERIDRKYQARRASEGLKGWWAELKKDPARYAGYIARRTASLKRKK